MPIRKLMFCFLTVLFALGVGHAQKTNNVWAFGIHAGLDFNTDPPTGLKSTEANGIKPPYYTTSICDKEGRLKFYTDGLRIWSAEHKPMPRYRNWWHWSGKVIPLICPYPDAKNDSLYYLFGVSNELNANKLIYLTLRLNNAGDFDEVVYPRPTSATSYYTTLTDNASVLLAGTAHCNQKDMWIVVHTPGALKSYLVTENGVATTPVITPLSPSLDENLKINGGYSNIKFSANGERMALPVYNEDFQDKNGIIVFDFNNQTGTFSNPVKLKLPPKHTLEDVELSVDGSKLYFGAEAQGYTPDGEPAAMIHSIYQMDLNAGSSTEIEGSLYTLGSDGSICGRRGCTFVYRTMQMGPTGKIYVSMRFVEPTNQDLTLSVIESPNEPKENARYRVNRIKVGKKYLFLNYNYIRSSAFSLRENGIVVNRKNCADKPAHFSLLFTKVDSVRWNFGDPSSGENNFSTSFTPSHQYPGPGTYTVKALIYSKCVTDTATIQLTVQQDKAVKVPESIKDTAVCIGNVLTLDAKAAFATNYEWDNGLIYSNRTIDKAGLYKINIWNECSEAKKSFEVRYKDCPCDVFTPNAFSPNQDGLNDEFRPVVQCATTDYSFKIYNRYGGISFASTEINKGWNGKVGIKESPSGVYLWSLQYRNPNSKELFVKHGTVILLR